MTKYFLIKTSRLILITNFLKKMEKKISKKIESELLKIAMENSVEIEERGDLKRHYSDSEDFIEVPVWGIEEMLKQAYELGRKAGK